MDYDEIAEYVCSFYDHGERIDWEDALDRVESAFDVDLGEDMLSPEIKAIKKAVREYRKATA